MYERTAGLGRRPRRRILIWERAGAKKDEGQKAGLARVQIDLFSVADRSAVKNETCLRMTVSMRVVMMKRRCNC